MNELRPHPYEAYLIMDEVNTQMRNSSCPAGEEESSERDPERGAVRDIEGEMG